MDSDKLIMDNSEDTQYKNALLNKIRILQEKVYLTPGEKLELEILLKKKWIV